MDSFDKRIMDDKYGRIYTIFNKSKIIKTNGLKKTKLCKLKDFTIPKTLIYRAGVIPYTKENGKLYFAFGLDTKFNELTDFAGGVKQTDDNVITGGIREFLEESLTVFDPVCFEDLRDSYVLYDEQMLIILIYYKVKTTIIKELFHIKKNKIMTNTSSNNIEFTNRLYSKKPKITSKSTINTNNLDNPNNIINHTDNLDTTNNINNIDNTNKINTTDNTQNNNNLANTHNIDNIDFRERFQIRKTKLNSKRTSNSNNCIFKERFHIDHAKILSKSDEKPNEIEIKDICWLSTDALTDCLNGRGSTAIYSRVRNMFNHLSISIDDFVKYLLGKD